MPKLKQEKEKKNQDIEKDLLLQRYARYVSMAHTIFSTLFSILVGVIFGTFGVITSLVQIGFIPWNKYYFWNVVLFAGFISSFVILLSLYKIYESRKMRSEIVYRLKSLYQ
ncbi:hypothetical protein HY485_01340 [Candidatus Woesearchaeota archaeon]|nr:hypothetical protein [Candidatus Woesearchaeota archaeon]